MKIKLLSKLGIALLILVFYSSVMVSQDFKTIGYLPTYRFSTIDDIELDRLTHLNIAFANPDVNGNLTTSGVNIDPIVEQAHDFDLEVFIALAGGAAKLSDWEDWIRPNNRSSFIHKIIDYTLLHNLQGIDVDLEWGNVNDDYSGFVIELRDSVDQHNLKLSVALPGTYRYPEVTDEALSSFDWINLMVYDLTGPWAPNSPGPHSPYSFALSSINYWVGQGIEKNIITLGVPFYGYDFTNPDNVIALRYATIIGVDSDYAQLDQVGQIYYNGLPTIEKKTMLAIDELSGIMIWEIGQDSFDEYSLLQKIDETIEDYVSTSTHEINPSDFATLYPNPVNDLTHIKLNEAQDIKIVLFSNCKKVLKEHRYSNQKLLSIDLSEFSGGIYFLYVEGQSFTKTFKIVKL
jgi:chitinase